MHRRANYHPHVRAFNAKPPKPRRFQCTSPRTKDTCAQTRWAMFAQARMRKKQAEIERNRFSTSRVRLHVQKVAPPKVVEVQVERVGSGIIACTAKVLSTNPTSSKQVTCQVTKSLNEPYGKGRQGGDRAAVGGSGTLSFFADTTSKTKLCFQKTLNKREQVHQLAGTFGDTPLVVLRKGTAVWVDVEVRQKDGQVRIVRDVRPKRHAHILWSCLPDGKHHKDYKIMIDNHQDFRDTFRGYLCDASSSVVVEPRTDNSQYLRFDAMLFRRLQHSVTEARHQNFRFLEDLNAYRLEWRNFFRAMFE